MHKLKNIITLAALTGLASCTSIDCTLDSVVVWTLSFYDTELEEPMKLPCLLSVDAAGAGTLYNRGQGISEMSLPMSHMAEADTLYLRWGVELEGDEESGPLLYEVTDVLTLSHENYPHFDAIDCPAAVFHTITDAKFTGHKPEVFPLVIDSVSITRPQVDYKDVENIRLFLSIHNSPAVNVAAPTEDGGEFEILGGELERK